MRSEEQEEKMIGSADDTDRSIVTGSAGAGDDRSIASAKEDDYTDATEA